MRSYISKSKSERGVALVLTLSVLAVVLLLVIGFAVSMRIERTATRNFTGIMEARQLTHAAIAEAMYLIKANTPVISPTRFYVTQPGGAAGASPYDFLFSTNTANGTVNLNGGQTILGANSIYVTPADREIRAGWVIVTNDTGTAIGRFAYWVDDEASKININAAEARQTANGVTTRDVDLSVLPLSGLTQASKGQLATDTWWFAQTNGYYTLEQWKQTPSSVSVGATRYKNAKFYLTRYSEGIDFTPWGTQKFDLNGNYNQLVSEITNGCVNTLNNVALTNFLGVGNTFTNKYSDFSGNTNLIKQIMANILDFRLTASGPNLWCTGGDNLDLGLPRTYGIPNSYLGLRRYPFLNEIGVIPTWHWIGAPGTQFRVDLWVFVELVNPYDLAWGTGGSVKINVDKLYFEVNADCGGTPCPGFPYNFGQDGGWNYPIEIPIPDISAHSYYLVSTNFSYDHAETVTNAFIDRVEARLNNVRLLQWKDIGATTFDNSIRDWASWLDFSQYMAPGSTSSNHFTFVGTNKIAQTDSQPSPSTSTQGLAKNDPRVRRFMLWTPPAAAWYRVGDVSQTTTVSVNTNATLGTQNVGVVNPAGGTGLTGVPNDPPPTTPPSDIKDHPSFYMKTVTTDLPYESIGELGYIHTGLQWRTLMLQPRPVEEVNAKLIPDWVVLDIFSVTNQPVQGRININAVVTNLASGTTPKRIAPLQSIVTGITPGNNTGTFTDQGVVATNIYNMTWVPGWTWGTDRNQPGGQFYFIPGLYNMIGELCEVDRVAANWDGAVGMTNDFAREARIRSFANLVTTRSEQFTVWAIGQSLDPAGNIIGEARAQVVVWRVQDKGTDLTFGTSDDTVTYRPVYFRWIAEP